jgi:cytochrome c peroxidase
LITFGDLVSVKGTPPTGVGNNTEPIAGLGTFYNGNSCAMCHLQPAIGGSSPGQGTPFFTDNPQFDVATHRGALNTPPAFVHKNDGPVVETRFVLNIDGSGNPLTTLDGSVHELYTIEGRDDAPTGCNVSQSPFFATEVTDNNLIFRIPTPTFGLGFVETTSNLALQNNLAASQALGFGTGGRFNTSGNDQTITRFGWKAQNSSMLMFAGEASNVEMGVSNELFPFEKAPGDCATNKTPEDLTGPDGGATAIALNPVVKDSDIEALAFFMFTNAAPAQCDFASGVTTTGVPVCNPLGASAQRGQAQFAAVGCSSCHTPQLTTGPSAFKDLNNALFQPFSDFAIHHMGSQLVDGVTQGQAGPDEFRTAPLWGLGQRRFFMHDGKNKDLVSAILRHASPVNNCTDLTSVSESFILNGSPVQVQPQTTQSCGSDADQVIQNFKNLVTQNPNSAQDLLNYLRSL